MPKSRYSGLDSAQAISLASALQTATTDARGTRFSSVETCRLPMRPRPMTAMFTRLALLRVVGPMLPIVSKGQLEISKNQSYVNVDGTCTDNDR